MDMVLQRFLADESGATSIEYALIGTLVSLAILTGMGALATEVQNMIGRPAEHLNP